MKQIFFAALLLTGPLAQAQDLAYKIPQNAMAVATVKGDKLLELLSIKEFNTSVLGRKLLEKMSEKKEEGNYTSIEDLGIRLNATIYYYNQQTDSISYNCVLLPLSDVHKFESLFGENKRDRIMVNGKVKTLNGDNENSILIWNEEMAYFVTGSLKDRYLEEDSARSERYGIKKVSYSDYYNNPDNSSTGMYAVDTAMASEAVADSAVAMPAYEAAAPVSEDSVPEEPKVADVPAVDYPPAESYPPPVIDMAPPVVTEEENVEVMASPEPATDNYYDNSAYEKAYNEQRDIKRKLVSAWMNDFAAANLIRSNSSGSILDNPAYLRSLDKNAAATFYLSDMPSLYQGILPYYSYPYLGMRGVMAGYGSINAKLFLNKEDIRITSEMEVDDEKAASCKKIYAHKPNKKFAKYINSDKMVGFMSYSFDTEAYLKELPQMLDQSLGRYLGLYHDEIGIGTELFTLLLDEKAVAKVIKGDALLLLTDIGPKEYTYTTYEYNDDYERKEVKKTKTETLPEFLFMMSSDDTHLIERILNYGVRKEQITLKNGIYSLDSKLTKGAPFNFHIVIQDGILFCGTSYREIQQISTDHYQGNITKEQKNLLLKNNASLFINPKNIVGKISEKEFGSSGKLRNFNTLLGNTGKMYARTTGIKGNLISGEMIAEVPEGKENALKYFFSLVDYASKLD